MYFIFFLKIRMEPIIVSIPSPFGLTVQQLFFKIFLQDLRPYRDRQQFSIVDNNELGVVSDEYTRIQEVSRLHDISIPIIQLADEPCRPLGHDAMQYSDLNFEMLIKMRQQYQTKQAAMIGPVCAQRNSRRTLLM